MPIAELSGVTLHYYLTNEVSNGTTIVLVNSLGADFHMWDKVVPYLEKEFQVLRYDARGHGLSSVPAIPYSIEQLGGDLLELLDVLSVDRVYFCGLSLGGLVGLWLGIHSPQTIRKMVLANTAARIGTDDGWSARIETVQSLGMATIAQQSLARWFTPSYSREHPEKMTQIGNMIARTSPDGYVGCCGVLRATDLRDKLAEIETPCLVITGSEDPATPPSDGRFLHSGLRNSTYLELNASHLTAWEKCEEFASAILELFSGKDRSNG